ncbi:hypothetical protein [Parafilimonas sp.]|uniref:hypothetical protein n=1 Tax=Parafilimonas sp. TaxID=1969739 RepID=UPI0039E62B76
MNKGKYIIISFLLFSFSAFAQDAVETNWDVLQAINFIPKYNAELKAKVLFPKFTDQILDMENKTVEVEGYVIPVDPTGAIVALSANPYAACYFCGKAGPASVMTIKLKTVKKKYMTDAYKKFKGTLRLNYDDIHEFYYILENAEQVKN